MKFYPTFFYPRSGSTVVDNLIGQHPQVLSLNEPFNRYYNKSIVRNDNHENINFKHFMLPVINNIPNPDMLLNLIKESNPKMVILSTPERNLVYKNTQLGPPLNPCHCREWTKEEFYNYVSSFGFKIIKHMISNKKQGTQLMLCEIKLK